MCETLHDKYSAQEKITKIDAATRQLNTAIRLFLEEKDLISVHTLSRAVHDIVRPMLQKKGGGSAIKDLAFIKPEFRKEFADAMNHPSNFFKHADRDPDDVLTFHYMLCPMWLMDCANMLKKLTGQHSRESRGLSIWFSVQYPELLDDEVSAQVQRFIDSGNLTQSFFTKKFCLQIIDNPKHSL